MAKQLHVLIVEDSEDDARLLVRAMRRGGFEPVYERVETAEGVGAALENETWDVVLCDMVMPGFSADAALKIVKQNGLDLPFIVVSGVIGMEDAVELMRAGAHDFVRKDDLARLVPALERELKDAEIRRQRKRAEEALRRNEGRFKDIAEAASDWFWEMGPDFRFTYHSDRYFEITGFRPEDKIGTSRSRYVDPGNLEADAGKWAAHEADLEARRPFRDFEYAFTAKDGGVRHVRVSGAPFFGAGGEFLGYRGTGTDITERARAEEASRRLAAAIERLSETFVLFDADDRIVLCNETFRNLHRAIPEATAPGTRFEDFIRAMVGKGLVTEALGREEAWIQERLERHRKPHGPFEIARQDGRCVLISEQRLADGGTATITTDITERKRAEEELRESEARAAKARQQLLDAVESSAASFILYDADERLVLCNSKAREFFPEVAELLVPGARFEDLTRARVERAMPASATGRVEDQVRARLDQFRHPGPAIEEHHADGRWTQAFERRTADGGTVCIRTDITEIKRAEEKLHTLSRAVEQSPAAVIITDTDGAIEYVNRAFSAITGYTRKDAIGQNPRILKSGQTPETTYERLWATVTAGKTWRGTFHNKRKDGTPYIADASISPIKRADGTIIHFLGIEQDVTERVEGERRLRRAERMEALGNLAGGIAHDFNNLLLPIMVLSQMTMEEFPRESAVRERMGKVVRAAESARNLVARILLFAHEEEPRLDICEICVVVRQAMELMESLLPSTIKIKVNLDPDTGIVSADAAQIETVLLNLASNAADAMNGKPGELELSLSRVEVDGKLATSVPGLKAGAYAMLSVADSGHGMDENTMNHLFDPFFTTKEVGEGTGLGLSTVHGIVTRHGGAIDVSSMPGLGSRFDVYLPLQKLRKMKHRPKKSRKREVARMTE